MAKNDKLLDAARELLVLVEHQWGDEFDPDDGPCEADPLCGCVICNRCGCVVDKIRAARAAIAASEGKRP